MADVLTQGEIDALLSALNSGELNPDELEKEEEKQKVKPYDFRSPQKFSKDHIRTLELIHDNFARIISNYLTAQVRTNVKIKIETVQQITYEEFIHSVPNPTILTIFKMPPLSGSILFETNPQFAYQIIDVLLGGPGVGQYKTREFTDIDKNIIKQINKGLIANLKLAWEDVIQVEPEIEGLETNPALNQTLAPNEPVALITFSVEMGGNSTFINICIPYLSIEKVLDKLVVQYWFRENDTDTLEESNEKLRRRMNVVELPMKAVLGSTKLTVGEFLTLSVGDVVTLDALTSSPVKMMVGNQPYLLAKPGTMGKNRGVQILDIIDKDVENYE
ncbi:flagellar motor switch protein FliM [Clostridium botulinum]|uniref:Flagellar motor switch protein FliM n=1 Tax=Clostridium botulinum TaxID=1491 RepID=A0A9Q1ZEA6_CLOBO|nr:flagellar motor switch protein FliM [Clostridium botulinum]AEB75770.1 flagellar motor switch protein FliM [Clostridium botulinum BKT015925]KEH98563.1 flagellar motor switch protein FliM [Clostridium botulinum D str. 16868]KEI03851.1 flagellar motor switch protein FliM [Clostridium botulinum C/D str. BKT75002]KEI05773.1 flagellar motor switch protein FliM [Clostridium botulinum C/D str. Sp77]KEI09059.1 flagellar motor switch protein FliM [Clostridium botulinum C/D str. BKT2873]